MTTTIQLGGGWNGEGYVVVSQGGQFNTIKEWRYKNGLVNGKDFAILFNDDAKISKEVLLKAFEILLSKE